MSQKTRGRLIMHEGAWNALDDLRRGEETYSETIERLIFATTIVDAGQRQLVSECGRQAEARSGLGIGRRKTAPPPPVETDPTPPPTYDSDPLWPEPQDE
jgi:hypothetical protein